MPEKITVCFLSCMTTMVKSGTKTGSAGPPSQPGEFPEQNQGHLHIPQPQQGITVVVVAYILVSRGVDPLDPLCPTMMVTVRR